MTLDDTNWTLVASVSKRPVHCQPRVVDLGRRFSSQYLIVQISTTNHKNTWNFGGEIWASYLLNGRQNYAEKRQLIAESSNLLIFPLIVTKYSLFYSFPKWFDNVNIKVYEYTGEIEEPRGENTLLSEIKELLANLSQELAANNTNSFSNKISLTENELTNDYLLGYY